MLRTTLAGLRAHLLRLLLTALAITLGVGFVSGTFVLTDTMRRRLRPAVHRLRRQGLGRGARARRRHGSRPPLLTTLKGLPGVQDAQGQVRGDAPLLGKDGKRVRRRCRPSACRSRAGRSSGTRSKSGRPPAAAGAGRARHGARRAAPGSASATPSRCSTTRAPPRRFTVSGPDGLRRRPGDRVPRRGRVHARDRRLDDRPHGLRGDRPQGRARHRPTSGCAAPSPRRPAGRTTWSPASELAQRTVRVLRPGPRPDRPVLPGVRAGGAVRRRARHLQHLQHPDRPADPRDGAAALRRRHARRRCSAAILVEAVVVGFVASVLGVLAGIGLGVGGAAIFTAADGLLVRPPGRVADAGRRGPAGRNGRHARRGPAAGPRGHAGSAGRRAAAADRGPGHGARGSRCARSRGRRSAWAGSRSARSRMLAAAGPGAVPHGDGRRDPDLPRCRRAQPADRAAAQRRGRLAARAVPGRPGRARAGERPAATPSGPRSRPSRSPSASR